MRRVLDIVFPVALAALILGSWEWTIFHWQVPHYVLPAPSAIARAICANFASLMASLGSTLAVTLQAFAAAGGVSVRPLRTETLFDGTSGSQLSDHEGVLVRYELTGAAPAMIALNGR